jgi:hypothetical protein
MTISRWPSHVLSARMPATLCGPPSTSNTSFGHLMAGRSVGATRSMASARARAARLV